MWRLNIFNDGLVFYTEIAIDWASRDLCGAQRSALTFLSLDLTLASATPDSLFLQFCAKNQILKFSIVSHFKVGYCKTYSYSYKWACYAQATRRLRRRSGGS